ncbi:VOC family protein [Allosphingosinicella sp.]|jgi:PhnB protein|uniref:VOC family protein n=1 Tax=Allosphingosinicella sp. TaxID=2823234 RepID=UPI002EDFF6F9
MYVPPGFATVTPYIFAEDAAAFVGFLVDGLGGTESCTTLRPDGKIANAQVAFGTATVMVSEATERFPQTRASYYLYVEDADAAMKRALDAGARLLMEVSDMPYGDRQGGVEDRAGNIWWISQRLVEEPYSA